MKKTTYILVFFVIIVLFSNALFAQHRGDTIDCSDIINLDWVITAGGIDDDGVNDVCTDNAGNIYITGYFVGTINFQSQSYTSAGDSDMFVAKLNSNGILQWFKTGSGPNAIFGTGIATDMLGNIYVTGGFNGFAEFNQQEAYSMNDNQDIFLIKYDPTGNIIWTQFLGGFYDDYPGGLVTDQYNNVMITGTYDFAMSVDGNSVIAKGQKDFFVAKFNSNGNLLWVNNHGSSTDDYGIDLACDLNGNVYVTGQYSGTLNFDSFTLASPGNTNIFLAKYDSFGVFKWALKSQASGNNDMAGSVTTDLYGNAFLTYKADQPNNMARLEKYSSIGTQLLSFGFGSSGIVYPKAVAVDNAGGIFITGDFTGFTDFGDGATSIVGGYDYFLIKLNSDGSFAYKDIAGSIDNDCGNAICFDNQNNIIVAGYANPNIVFDGTNYPGIGKEEILVVKYNKFFGFGDITISSIGCDPNNMCVDVEIIGGTEPYVFYWSDIISTPNVCGLSVGNHELIVTDDNNCFIHTDIVLETPSAPSISFPANIIICPIDTINLDAGAGFVSYLWNNSETSQSIEITQPGTYSVTVMDENSCTATASTLVSQLPNINLLVDDYVYICVGEQISFSVEGFTQYLWSNGSTSSTFTTGNAGIHWIRAYNGNCYYYDTIQVIHFPKPDIDLGGDRVICDGDSIFIAAPPGFSSYLWQDNSTNDFFWASEEGLVSLSVSDANGCEAIDAIEVTTDQAPYVNLGIDSTYCSNIPIIIYPNDQSDDNTYLWSDGSVLDNLAISETGTYWVDVTNIAGCVARDSINLRIFPEAIVELGGNINFCEGESATISAEGDFISWIWSDESTNPTIDVTQTGMYSVTVVDANNCVASDTVFTHMHIILNPFIGHDTTLCNNEDYILKPPHHYEQYVWNNGSTDSYIIVNSPGYYSLTVSNSIGCSASAGVYIDYAEGPEIIEINSGGGSIIVIADGGTPPLRYSHNGDSWQYDNIFEFLPTGTYTISVMDQNYCMVTAITFLDASIKVPSFFTPNGDGYNDVWRITGLYHFPSAEVQIFDRFGKKLYEFANSDDYWDGKYMGLPLPSDTYWYSIRLEEHRRPLTGHVTIKR